jgi:hypothetical protein
VIQPAFEPAHTTITIPREEIEQFGKTVDLAVTRAKNPRAEFSIGKHCTYCPAKIICPEWKKRTEDLIDLTKHHKDWAPENISRILHAGADFMKLYEAAKERAKHELAHGKKIPGVDGRPGWRIDGGRKMQSWKEDPGKTIALLRGTFGLKTKEIQDVISPAQAKKLVPKDQHASLDEHIDVKMSAPSLKSDSDAGAPAVPAAAFARAAQSAQAAITKPKQAKAK